MQDYSNLFTSRLITRQRDSKLKKIRRLLLSGLKPELILLLIAVIVLPREMMMLFKK